MSKGKMDALNKLGSYIDGMSEAPETEAGVKDEELRKGIEVEMTEHGMDEETATKTAMEHLKEDPAYYSKLEEMEGNSMGENDDSLGEETEEGGESESVPKISISVLARNKAKGKFGR